MRITHHRPSYLFCLPLLFYLLAMPLQATEKGKFLGAKETVYPDWFKESFLDLREDIQEAADQDRRIVIFFHQDGCPYCNLMVQRNLSQKEISDLLQQKMDVIAINMFGDREVTGLDGESVTEKTFAAAMRVQFTPTLLFFDEEGRVILRLNGYIPPQNFKLALDYVSGRKEGSISYRDYLAQNRPAQPKGALQRQPFFMSSPFDLQQREDKPLIVLFEQIQCPHCDRLHRELLSDPSIRGLLENYDVVQLDMWSSTPVVTADGQRTDARSWARQLKVNFVPTLILFNPQGEEIIRSEAVFKRFHTKSILDYGLNDAYRDQPSFQRFLSARSERIREQGKDVDIWR